jgi:hypothetical protein
MLDDPLAGCFADIYIHIYKYIIYNCVNDDLPVDIVMNQRVDYVESKFI